MSRTPDRFPGIREEESLLLLSGTLIPSQEGESAYVSGSFQMKDNLGTFNPRSSGSLPTPENEGEVLITLNGTNFTSEIPLIGNGWLVSDTGRLLVVG